MKTLIIYDNTGRIFGTCTGDYVVPEGGINYIEVEIPDKQRPVSVNVETRELVCEEIPPTAIETMQDEVTSIQMALIELYEGMGV